MKSPSKGLNSPHDVHKYNKVNQQKKFHLLTLVYRQNKHVLEAARIVGINYLTTKTILFFSQEWLQYLPISHLNSPYHETTKSTQYMATYVNVKRQVKHCVRIEIFCLIDKQCGEFCKSSLSGM